MCAGIAVSAEAVTRKGSIDHGTNGSEGTQRPQGNQLRGPAEDLRSGHGNRRKPRSIWNAPAPRSDGRTRLARTVGPGFRAKAQLRTSQSDPGQNLEIDSARAGAKESIRSFGKLGRSRGEGRRP